MQRDGWRDRGSKEGRKLDPERERKMRIKQLQINRSRNSLQEFEHFTVLLSSFILFSRLRPHCNIFSEVLEIFKSPKQIGTCMYIWLSNLSSSSSETNFIRHMQLKTNKKIHKHENMTLTLHQHSGTQPREKMLEPCMHR